MTNFDSFDGHARISLVSKQTLTITRIRRLYELTYSNITNN